MKQDFSPKHPPLLHDIEKMAQEGVWENIKVWCTQEPFAEISYKVMVLLAQQMNLPPPKPVAKIDQILANDMKRGGCFDRS